jgi:NitT/TauT family transport system permease protein
MSWLLRLHTLWSVVLFLGAWELGTLAVGPERLPGPWLVFHTLLEATASGDLPYHLAITLARVAAAFCLAMLIGSAIGILLGRREQVDRFFNSWLITLLNIPALVIIILSYVWFGLVEAAAIAAVVVNKVPNVAVIMREGARSMDRDYVELAQVYRFGFWKTLRHVTLPQLYPYLMASARSGLSLIWKIVLVVELLGRSNGMGFQLHLFFQLFDVASILAYTCAFVLVIQMIELAVLRPLDNAARRWRR